MSKYRRIKSVAYGFSHSFVSLMNWEEGQYVMDRLISIASKNAVEEIELDILRFRLLPKITNVKEIMMAVDAYCKNIFPRILSGHGLTMEYVREARMSLQFFFSDVRPDEDLCSGCVIVPYRCRTVIVDDKGRRHEGTIDGEEVTSENNLVSVVS